MKIMSAMNHLYRNVKGQKKEDYKADYLMALDVMDWEQYDYTTWPCADMSFPDIDENELCDVWPFKAELGQPHWVDLNSQFRKGIDRYGYANRLEMPEAIKKMQHAEATEKLNSLWASIDSNPAELSQLGFSDAKHLEWAIESLKSAEAQAYGEAEELLKEKHAESQEKMNQAVDAAKEGGLLDPINGVDMETWAAANAKIANGMGLEEVLTIVGVEKPVWDEVSAEWNSRMSQDTTYAITKVYGDAFVNSDIGKFANAVASGEAPATVGGADSPMEKVKNDFDLYIKIMCHQNAASAQGKDAQSILEGYGLTAADWGVIGGHWSGQMTTDIQLATKMGELMNKYNAEFATANVGDDISF